MRATIAFGAASIILGYTHSRVNGFSHDERLYKTRAYNHGGDAPIALMMELGPAMIFPPFTASLAIPGLFIGMGLSICEMVGLAIFDQIDEGLYKYSSYHKEQFDEYKKQEDTRQVLERESINGGSGNPQFGRFFD